MLNEMYPDFLKMIKIKDIPYKSKIFSSVVLGLMVMAFSFLSLKIFPAPYLIIGISWIVLLIHYSIVSSRSKVKIICINLSAIILAFTLFEFFLGHKAEQGRKSVYENSNPGPLVEKNDILGYSPRKDNKVKKHQYINDELIYTSTYTIDRNGLRQTEGLGVSSSNDGCVLFFGGSYVFGEAVDDNETLPFQVGLKSQWKFRIYNFGFAGYGPHQMLSALEHKFVENIVTCDKSRVAIYLTHVDHVQRAAGRADWDTHGPKYALDNNGKIQFVGNFDTDREYISNSEIYKQLFRQGWAITPDNNNLYTGIVSASMKSFKKLYPGGKFYVLLWDEEVYEELNREILEGLRHKGINVLLISEMLPNFFTDPIRYRISPHDSHPNPTAYEMIAEYVVNNILNFKNM